MRSKVLAIKAALIITAAVLLNSLTAFAYDDVIRVDVNQQTQEVQSKISISESEGVFYFGSGYFDVAEITYDYQFTDEEGNVYSAEVVEQQRINCNHTYQSGIYQTHVKGSDGSCTIEMYNAKRCTSCVYLVIGDYLNTITYVI